MVSLQSIILVFFLNNFSRVINLLLTKLARDRPGRILALGLFCADLATKISCVVLAHLHFVNARTRLC